MWTAGRSICASYWSATTSTWSRLWRRTTPGRRKWNALAVCLPISRRGPTWPGSCAISIRRKLRRTRLLPRPRARMQRWLRPRIPRLRQSTARIPSPGRRPTQPPIDPGHVRASPHPDCELLPSARSFTLGGAVSPLRALGWRRGALPFMDRKRILASVVVFLILAALVYLQYRHWRTFDWGTFWNQTHRINKLHVLHGVALIYVAYIM